MKEGKTDMETIKIADEHPMILEQRAAMRAVHRELNEAKEYGQKYRVSDLETKLRRMRKDLKEAYENLHKAGWK